MKFYLFALLASFLVLYCSAAANTGASLQKAIRELIDAEEKDSKNDAYKDDAGELLKRIAKVVVDNEHQRELEKEVEEKNKKLGELLESISHKKALEELARKRALQAKKTNEDNEEEQVKLLAKALLAKLEEKSNDKKNSFTDFFHNLGDSAKDTFSNLGQSLQQTFTGDEGKPRSQITLPNDFPTGSTDPCDSPVYIDSNKGASGLVKFPPNGGNYPRNKNCKWVFEANGQYNKVLLKFTRMNIEEDHPCDDYVQVYSMDCEDIKSSNGRQYDVYDQSGRLCYYHMTNQNNGTFPISKPCAYVEFRSDFWDQESGFDLSYAFLTV